MGAAGSGSLGTPRGTVLELPSPHFNASMGREGYQLRAADGMLMVHRVKYTFPRTALGQIRLSPRPPKCHSGASVSSPVPDSIAATARISGLKCRAHLQQARCTEGGRYSITSSARARSVGGMVIPSALADF